MGTSHSVQVLQRPLLPLCLDSVDMAALCCRDFVDLFTAIVKVLCALCERPHVLSHVNSIPKMLATWDGVNRVLQSQLKIEGQYLAQLETKKGSDAGAEQATRRLISRKDQFVVLKTLTNFVRAKVPDAETAAADRSRAAPAALEGVWPTCTPLLCICNGRAAHPP